MILSKAASAGAIIAEYAGREGLALGAEVAGFFAPNLPQSAASDIRGMIGSAGKVAQPLGNSLRLRGWMIAPSALRGFSARGLVVRRQHREALLRRVSPLSGRDGLGPFLDPASPGAGVGAGRTGPNLIRAEWCIVEVQIAQLRVIQSGVGRPQKPYLRSRDQRALQLRPNKRRALQLRPIKRRALQLRMFKPRALQLRPIKRRALQPRQKQRRALQLRLIKRPALQLRLIKRPALQLRPNKPRALQLRPI